MKITDLRLTNLDESNESVNTEGFGPCVDGCQHKECETRRQIAEQKCLDCGMKIGFQKEYIEKSVGRFTHARC